MYRDIINYILKVLLRHKGVFQVKYQGRSYINQQNNNKYLQGVIENNPYIQHNNDVLEGTININILGQPKDNTDILRIQNDCFQVGVEAIAYMMQDPTMKHLLLIRDWDYLFLTNFTDDNSAGVRLSLDIILPDPIDYCILTDNFLTEEDMLNDKDKFFNAEYEITEQPALDLTPEELTTDEEKNQDVNKQPDNHLLLKPIKLKRKP